MKAMMSLLMLLTALGCGLAADVDIGVGFGGGYVNWNGWDGYSIAASGGPSLAFGQFGLGAAFLLGQSKVTTSSQSLAFMNFGGLVKARYSVLEAGAGYVYIPGFTDESGGYYSGTGSPLLSLGVGLPFRVSDRLSLHLGASNLFVTKLAGFYNPSAGVAVAYRLARPAREPKPEPPVQQPVPKEEVTPPAAVVVTPKPEEQPRTPTGGEVKPAERARFPPRLEGSPAFVEMGKKNSALDAGERAYIVVAVTNKGKGAGENLRVKVEPISTMSGVNVGGEQVIELLRPGACDSVRVQLEAARDLRDQEIRFRVSVIEPTFGADALPAVIKITAKGLEPPELYIYDTGLNDSEGEYIDANGNGQLEINEQVEITNGIQNRGAGAAQGVTVRVRSLDPNVLLTADTMFQPGDIASGDWRTVMYPVYVNTRFQGKEVRLVLDIREARPDYSCVDTVVIPLNRQVRKTSEVVIAPKGGARKRSGAQPPSLTDSLLVDIPKGRENPNGIAVVVGVSNYKNVSKVEYAKRDAEAMRRYLVEAFGYSDGNIIVLDDPSKGDLERTFGAVGNPEGQLFNWASRKPGKCDVFVYYVGHGAPSIKEKKGYLVPADASPDYIEINGYPLDVLYANLAKVPAKSLTVVLDACFSGETPDAAGQVTTLLQGASPLVVAPITENVPANAVVMTAASGSQIASWYPDKRHSLFTYYLLKGLKGSADTNHDGVIKLSELQRYVSANVAPVARAVYNREQTPEIRGDSDAGVLQVR